MHRGCVFVIVVLGVLLLATGAYLWLSGESGREPEPTSAELDCCQCTALGKDQHYPFPEKPGYTCEEWCFQGCLERQSEFVCKLGQVSGYALACPDVLMSTVTPFGE